MHRVPLVDRIVTIKPLAPRESSAMAKGPARLVVGEPVVLAGEKEGIAAVEAAARRSRDQVAALGRPVIAEAKVATGQVGAMATILELGRFYDQATIDDVRGFHGSARARVDEAGRGALERAARIFAEATRTFLRIVAGTFLPGVVRASTEAATAQRPAYEAMEAGIDAATAELAMSVHRVPATPTVPGRST